jgi:hypothetical protein
MNKENEIILILKYNLDFSTYDNFGVSIRNLLRNECDEKIKFTIANFLSVLWGFESVYRSNEEYIFKYLNSSIGVGLPYDYAENFEEVKEEFFAWIDITESIYE